MPYHENLAALFRPESVAVIGASLVPGKFGNSILCNIIDGGFKGAIYPVNPRGGTIRGLEVLRKLAHIPAASLDLAVICLPAEKTPQCLRELGALQTKAAVITGSSFRESGCNGAALEEEVKRLARHYGIALLGPNSLGVSNNRYHLNATYGYGSTSEGSLGFLTQSGALGMAVSEWAREHGFGFSSFVSIGNKALINESDILAYLADDPDTEVILGYLESVEDGQRFLRNAHDATRKKPVILLKSARTRDSAQVVTSHTGAMVGQDMAFDAAFRQTGIIRADRLEDLFDLAQAFASQPLPKGPGLGIISNAGGPSILATDACERVGLSMARLSPATLSRLRDILPEFAAFNNPVYIMHDAEEDRFSGCMAAMLEDAAVQSLLVILTNSPALNVVEVIRSITEKVNFQGKPVFFCLLGGQGIQQAKDLAGKRRIPIYPFPESAIDVIAAMYRHSQWKDNPLPVEVGYRHDAGMVRRIIDEARQKGLHEFVEYQAQGILRAYELPALEARLARTSTEAIQIARQIGFPVAMKIASPHISHKTDAQGIRLHLDTPDKVKNAFAALTAPYPEAGHRRYIAGCLVQAMAPPNSREVVMGFRRDACFGPVILFGLGGIHVEAFNDITCRLAPLSLDDVHDMVREIHAFPILAGFRGERPVKFTALEDILLILSQLSLDFPEIQEVELNPIFVNEQAAFVGDIRVRLSPASTLRTLASAG